MNYITISCGFTFNFKITLEHGNIDLSLSSSSTGNHTVRADIVIFANYFSIRKFSVLSVGFIKFCVLGIFLYCLVIKYIILRCRCISQRIFYFAEVVTCFSVKMIQLTIKTLDSRDHPFTVDDEVSL